MGGATELGLGLVDFEDEDVAFSETVSTGYLQPMTTLVFDLAGKLLGFEIAFASQGLPQAFLDSIRNGDVQLRVDS